MSSEWSGQRIAAKRSSTSSPDVGAPTMGPADAAYQGRIVIEVWKANASTGDGLRFSVTVVGDGNAAGADGFLRETIARMTTRLAGQARPPQ